MMAMLHSLFLFCLLRCQRAAMLTFYDDGVADNIQSDIASTNGKGITRSCRVALTNRRVHAFKHQ